MKLKNKENMVLGGIMMSLGVVGFVINYIKARDVNKRVDNIKHHVENNFLEFSKLYNNHIDFENNRTKFIFDQIDEVVEEVGTCYEHIEKLIQKEDKAEEVCDEVI